MYVDDETPEEAPQEETKEQEEVEAPEEATSEENTAEAPEEEAAPEETPAEEPAPTEDAAPEEEAAAPEEAAPAEEPASGEVKTDDRGREIHSATCADCGQTCEIPFKPDPEKPVYCRDCYQKHRPPRRSFGGGGGGGFGGGGRGGGGGGSFSRGPREMHDATCAKCGKACQVPFKPSGERPVYCRDCYQK